MPVPERAWSAEQVVQYLRTMENPANIAGMARFGIATEAALGISNVDLRGLARQIGKNHQRSLALWKSGIREARLLAAYTDEHAKVSLDQARKWAADFRSWEIVDGVSDLFVRAGLQEVLIPEFAEDEREFVRRSAFAMMAWSAVHLKTMPDAPLLAWLSLVERCATDPRNFVRKAVNWALRQIGKRNLNCHRHALDLAHKFCSSADKTARWIGRDAFRELSDAKLTERLTLRPKQ